MYEAACAMQSELQGRQACLVAKLTQSDGELASGGAHCCQGQKAKSLIFDFGLKLKKLETRHTVTPLKSAPENGIEMNMAGHRRAEYSYVGHC
jgi:hypothetical protein